MRKAFLIISILALTQQAIAFHIVGGEIELIHLNGFNYRLNLIQYFDRAQSDNNSPDGVVTVYFFRESDDSEVLRYTLPFISETRVDYTNNECAIGELITAKMVYSDEIYLDPEVFSDPEGYYVVWERCCRNEGIVNIVSPGTTGMTYVLDFPPVTKDGEPFVNSTPTILPPLSDYACVDQLYYADFRGTDLDGDSLAYSLVVPINSSAVEPVPLPSPKNFHAPVVFSEGISLSNVVPGSPSLAIDSKGFLTVNPSDPGLYVFSVLVKEFRDGEQIGQVTRDFQMLVIDGCNPPDPPVASVKLPGDDTIYEDDAFISFTVAEEKCFDFQVGNIGPEENVMLRVVPVNFDGSTEGFTFMEDRVSADSSNFRVCIPECPLKPDEPYIIDMIAQDNACPLPQMDTVRLTIDVEPPPNEKPQFVDIDVDTMQISINEGDDYVQFVEGIDLDVEDTVNLYLYSPDISPAEIGISVTTTRRTAGSGEVLFQWLTDCEDYDFTEQNEFSVALIVDDEDFCDEPGDTLWFDLDVVLPFNSDPVITPEEVGNNNRIEIDIDNTLEFDVSAFDADLDLVNLRLEGEGFNPESYNIDFANVSGFGQVESEFVWDISCSDVGITEDTEFTFHLVADDEDRCRVKNYDSLSFTVMVITPFNNKPEFEDLFPDDLYINETYEFEINANDLDDFDFVNIDLLPGQDLPPSDQFEFVSGNGRARATSTIVWTPTCDILGEGFTPVDYDIIVLAYDERCPVPKYDTLELNFTINNVDVVANSFSPPNVFTPNGDNINDVYTLSNLQTASANLPADNCFDEFQYFSVVDRSGIEVYRTDSRDFVWDGGDLPSGVYFYFIKYKNTDYKGTLSILY